LNKDIEFISVDFSSPKASSMFRIEHVPFTGWCLINLSDMTEDEKMEQLADIIYYNMPEEKKKMFLML